MKKRFILLFVFALASTSLLYAQNDYVDEDVVNAYQKYKKGKRLSAEEEYYLAEVYLNGYFGERFDPQRYLSLINSAAKRGDDYAQYDVELGVPFAHLASEYLFMDDLERTRYYGQKAIQISGDFRETEGIGLVCANRALNARISRNYKLAYTYARLGADMGNASATAELALCYGYGYGVAKDIDKAYALLRTAREMPYYSFYDEYERAYTAFGRQTNSSRLSAINTAQYNAENNLMRSASSNNSSSILRTFVASALVVAGIVAVCEALAPKSTSSSSSSSNSYYTSLSSSNSVSLCPDCSGRGMMNCVWCYGTGIIKGGLLSHDETCFHCEGRGQEWCWHCSGRGSR